MAVVVLAALGLTDFATSARAKRLFTTASGRHGPRRCSGASTRRVAYNRGVVLSHKARIIFIGLDLLPFIALALLLVIGRLLMKRAVTPL